VSSKRKGPRHGDGIRAPEEGSNVPFDDSPQPPVTRSAERGDDGQPSDTHFVGGLWSLTKLGAGVAFVVGASVAVAWSAHRYALTTPRFAVREVQVDGENRLSEQRVAKLGGIEIGQNIFALDTVEAERQLLQDPWVRQVRITRELPNRLRIELTERQAGALTGIGGQLYLVTPTGEPFKQLGEGDPSDLPLVTGVSAYLLARDREAAVERLQTGLRVLRDYERLPLSRIHVAQEVHVGDDGKVVLTIGKDGIALHLGRGPFKKPLAMAARVMGKLARKGQAPRIIFLDNKAHPERVVARMK
jgi:cell division protein FtsQ